MQALILILKKCCFLFCRQLQGNSQNRCMFRDEIKRRKDILKRSSSYPVLGVMSHLSKPDTHATVIATMSFTLDLELDPNINTAVILSIGYQSKFVEPDYEINMVENIKLRPDKLWALYTCPVEGGFIKILEHLIRDSWDRMENGPVCDIGCHALIINGADRFEHQKSMNRQHKVKFTALKGKRAQKECNIDIHSHRPRAKALHDELMLVSQSYAKDWHQNTPLNIFFEKHCRNLTLWPDEVVSFQYPIISLGFPVHQPTGRYRSAKNHIIYYSNHSSGTTHHRFNNEYYNQPRRPNSNFFYDFLRWEKNCT